MLLGREDIIVSNYKWFKETITNHDNLQLSALLRFQSKRKVVVVCHGFTGSKEGGGRALKMADKLAELDYSTVLFDFSGCGDSEGTWDSLTLTSQITDLKSVIHWCQIKGFEEVYLNGRSFGGSTALCCAPQSESVKAVCTWAAVAKPAALFKSLVNHTIKGPGKEFVEIIDDSGFIHQIKKNFFYDLEKYDVLDCAAEISPRPLLIIHGTEDKTVPVSQARELYEAAHEPKELLTIDGADHRFTNHIIPVWNSFFQWLNYT